MAGPLVCSHLEFKVSSAVLCTSLPLQHPCSALPEVSPCHPRGDGKMIGSKLEYTAQITFLISFLQYCTYAYMHISTVRQENEIAGRENSPNVTRCYFWAWLELYKLSTRHILFLMRKIKWFKKKKSWLYLPRKPLNLGFHPALLPQCWGANTQERSVFSLNSPLPASLFSISRLCWMWNPDATGIDLHEVTSPGLYFMIFQYHDAGLMLSLIRLLAC